MATLALYALGSAIGSAAVGGSTAAVAFGLSGAAIGGAVGSAVGAYIDANYIFPPNVPDSQGPRLNEYNIQATNEGSGINRCFGPENRVAGTIMWIGRHENSQTDLTMFEERVKRKKVGGKGGGGGTQTTYTYFADVAIAVAEGKVSAIRQVWADSKVIFQTGVEDARYEAIELYTGSEDAVADASMTNNSSPSSHMESFEGAGEVPKYKGISYVVFDSLAITDFGNRLPSFNFLVEVEEQKSIRSVLADILDRAGVASANYDVSRVKDCLTGYHVTGPIQSTRVLEPILQAYDILVAEVDSVLHFFHRGDEFVVPVREADLGSIDGPFPVQFSEINDNDKATSMVVNFIDANNSYDQGSEEQHLIDSPVINQGSIEVPLVITPDLAATIGVRRLYRQQVESLEIALRLPPSYIQITETDLITLPVNGETYTAMVTKKSQGESGAIELVAKVVDSELNVLSATGSTATNNPPSPGPYVAPVLIFDAFSIPALIDAHAQVPIYYTAATTQANGTAFSGAADYDSPSDVTANFNVVQPLSSLSTMGVCSTTLAGGVTPDLWDYTNTVDVTVYRGTLESVTENEVAAGANHCLIGNEIVGFTTATLLGTNQYRLSGLMRGRRDTNVEIDSHGASERFIFLESDSLIFTDYNPGLFGSTRYHRVVSNGQTVDDVASDTVGLDGDSVKPFSPTLFTSSRDGSDNLTINWTRRSRAVWDPFSAVSAPNYEGQEVYEIDILSGSGGSVVRTITVTNTTTTAYSAANQTADGLTSGNTVYAIAYMVDAAYGRGWPTEELAL